MLKHPTDLIRALIFYLIALALALGAALTPGITTAAYMFTPMVAVLLTMLAVTCEGYSNAGWASLGLHRRGLLGWPVALLAPLLVMVFAYGVLWGTNFAPFSCPHRSSAFP